MQRRRANNKGGKILPNEELATAIRQVKSGKEYHFALIAKSGNTQLTMDKRKISGEDIARMKKTAGGGNVLRGTAPPKTAPSV